MTKCDFCYLSKNTYGKLVCHFGECMLRQSDILKILEQLAKIKGE